MPAAAATASALSTKARHPSRRDPQRTTHLRPNPDTSSKAVVIGAGLTGLAAGLALRAAGASVTVAAGAHDAGRMSADQRTTALLPTSVELLKNLGIWDSCRGHSAALTGVRIVDDRGGMLRAPEVLFEAREAGLPDFGANVPNAVLKAALHARATADPGVEWAQTRSVMRILPGAEAATLELAEGGSITAGLIVAADGRDSLGRSAAGITTRTWDYGQTAVATSFRHSRPHGGIATELHRRAGPLTTVPLPGDRSSLVWVEEPAAAARLAGLDAGAFRVELARRLQGLLGELDEIGPRACFPLSGLAAHRMGQQRVALVGESAHVLPPIGAQGLNLSLRDAAVLADCISNAMAHGEDIGNDATLAAYHDARIADTLGRVVSVDLLNRSLLLDFLPVQAMRGVGLHLVANFGPLRHLLMRSGLQAPGPVPRLMQSGGGAHAARP